MIRLICTLCALLVWLTASPALAQGNLADKQLQRGSELAQDAFAAAESGDFTRSERLWSELIEVFPTNPAVWSNRGNVRVSQNKLDAAIADFNESIRLDPDAPDPYLNRGIAYEGQGRWEDAIADYNHVLALTPNDPMAYNNRGNAQAGLQRWDDALADYQKAADIAPNFAFARANAALIYYQVGDEEKAEREMRNLVRKYPMFPDMRAALSAVLWTQGKQGEAESNWVAAMGIDKRYRDIDWVERVRRWPPGMVAALDKFIKIDS
ncbi:tetratricopeptide TPR_11 repeat-containing protein [Rubidibacter lacunae KORDI 51-2]|uniref:Tetratricopeptide TPR_11 repeat-containing protein n=1 Tax=Rubidibacter lacunae KORDI 51-2 TaxID=582515 RepID=U5DKQ4_9CHRO|nr:tetratricopeptide repeat protein [Rubidibacter lacunae]ERN40305.1 tetratricopeptide TPR_11 repeat-containing protein [Rubidibacter lacunae KORDI 51-2]